MRSFKDISIDKKLKILIMATSASACAAVCIILIFFAVRIYATEQLASLDNMSTVIGRNVHAALVFDIPEDAMQIVSSVEDNESIVFAGVYDINGNLFAGHQNDESFIPPERPDFHGHEIKHGMLYFYKPIVRDDKILGSICLVDNLYLIRRVTFRTVTAFLIILFFVLGVTYIIVSHMQKMISSPVKELTEKANKIARERDYRVRMRHERQDELGVLAAAFNIMLSQIEAQSKELERANANLEESVQARTSELKDAQEKLLRTQKLALIGELAGSIAHELRTPLGVLKNSAYYLRMRLSDMIDDKKIMRHIDMIEDEIASSDRIITDVLTFARVKQPEFSEEDMNDIVQEALGKVFCPDNVKLKLDLKKDLPKIYVDRNQMVQVLCNLIVNAIESMPEGGDLKISSDKISHFVRVKVSDAGTGISEENIEKIFEPIFSTKVKGTGLGLSTCKTLVSLHNGNIEVKSTVGKGSTFTLKLPLLVFPGKINDKEER